MNASSPAGGNGRGVSEAAGLPYPEITMRWLRSAVSAHRAAFEDEMERRRRQYNPEFERFWRRHRSQAT